MAEVFYVTFGDFCALPPRCSERLPSKWLDCLALRNHPLPDGNKRCAFLALERFLAANGLPVHDADPGTDVPMVEKIAAGEATPNEIIGWLESRTAH